MSKILRSPGQKALLRTLIELRNEADLTQRALADRLEKPRSYVSKIETGERYIDPNECVDWALGCEGEPLELFRRFIAYRDRR